MPNQRSKSTKGLNKKVGEKFRLLSDLSQHRITFNHIKACTLEKVLISQEQIKTSSD